MLELKNISKNIVPLGELTLEDGIIDELELLTSVEHMLDDELELQSGLTMVANNAPTTDPAAQGLLSLVSSILSQRIELDPVTDVTASLEGIAIPGYGLENRLKDLGNYLLEAIKKLIAKVRDFFNNTDAKVRNYGEKLKDAKVYAELGMKQNAKLTDPKVVITVPSKFIDSKGELSIYHALTKVASDLNKVLLGDMYKLMSAMEATNIDMYKVLARDTFTFKDISPFLDSMADLVYRMKLGLIAVIDGSADGKKVTLDGTEVFILQSVPGIEYHFDLGNMYKYDSLKLTADKLEVANAFKFTYKVVDWDKANTPVLSLAEISKRADILQAGSEELLKWKVNYGPTLNNYEGMFSAVREKVNPNITDKDMERMSEKAIQNANQLLLVTMKIFSGLSVKVMTDVEHALRDHTAYVIKSINAYDITEPAQG